MSRKPPGPRAEGKRANRGGGRLEPSRDRCCGAGRRGSSKPFMPQKRAKKGLGLPCTDFFDNIRAQRSKSSVLRAKSSRRGLKGRRIDDLRFLCRYLWPKNGGRAYVLTLTGKEVAALSARTGKVQSGLRFPQDPTPSRIARGTPKSRILSGLVRQAPFWATVWAVLAAGGLEIAVPIVVS